MMPSPAPDGPAEEAAAGDVPTAEVIDLDPTPLRYPPAVRETCACGKDGTPFSHGEIPGPHGRILRPFTCDEVLADRAIAQAIAERTAPRWWRRLLGGAR
ncbi:hypothetical protein BJF78_24615 [Pseudonocardia sp. CNS-139]|nr:hypothetical protein BJF78_24615 [Pseudonocardia sp. CNS-139]